MPIFLSYSRKNEATVKVLAQGFEAAGREVWFDRELGGGDAWWDKILDNIRQASVFVFALSDSSLESKPCRSELAYAEALKRPILPVQVGTVTNFRGNPLAELQILPFRPDDAMSAFEIMAAVDAAAARVQPLPDPLPAEPPIPFLYLLGLGRQIDNTELNQADQLAIVDQMRRSLGEESDMSARQEILSLLNRLMNKPWSTKRTEFEIKAILYAAQAGGHEDDHPIESETIPPQPTVTGPASPPPEPDGRRIFEERMAALRREAEEQQKAQPPPSTDEPGTWRPAGSSSAYWGQPTRTEEDAGPPPRTWPGVGQASPSVAGAEERSAQPSSPVAGMTQSPTAATAHTPAQPVSRSKPPSHWVLSTIALTSVLFGAIALYFSYQVGQRFQAGDDAGAREASRYAKVWGIIGIVLAVLTYLVWYLD